MSVAQPLTRTDRPTSGSVPYSASTAPPVVVRRPEPRPIATTTPHIDYELAVKTRRLTEREIQTLKGMARGQSNSEIGRELFISEDTVKTHARRLFLKLLARDRAHAVQRGWEQGILRAGGDA